MQKQEIDLFHKCFMGCSDMQHMLQFRHESWLGAKKIIICMVNWLWVGASKLKYHKESSSQLTVFWLTTAINHQLIMQFRSITAVSVHLFKAPLRAAERKLSF